MPKKSIRNKLHLKSVVECPPEADGNSVRLPPELNDQFFKALRKGNVVDIYTLLHAHPEAALARDYPQHDEELERANFRPSETEYAPALCVAAAFAPIEIVRELLRLGADATQQQKYKGGPLHMASDIEKIDLLLAHGARIDATDYKSLTAYTTMLLENDLACAKHLQNLGASIENADMLLKLYLDANRNVTYSIAIDYRQVLSYIIDDLGADIQKRDYAGETPLLFAVPTMHNIMIDELVRHGADVNAQDSDGITALMRACIGRESANVQKLLDLGAEPNTQDKQGRTALFHFGNRSSLMLGGHAEYERIGDMLIAAKADPYIANKEGFTPHENHIHVFGNLPEDPEKFKSKFLIPSILERVEKAFEPVLEMRAAVKKAAEISHQVQVAKNGTQKRIPLQQKIKIRRQP